MFDSRANHLIPLVCAWIFAGYAYLLGEDSLIIAQNETWSLIDAVVPAYCGLGLVCAVIDSEFTDVIGLIACSVAAACLVAVLFLGPYIFLTALVGLFGIIAHNKRLNLRKSKASEAVASDSVTND